MAQEDIALLAHLMRHAGFGATREELEARIEKGYEATVEELLHPEGQEPVDIYELYRYHPRVVRPSTLPPQLSCADWIYHMINTKRPLEEKMALFWHQVFATGNSKVDDYNELTTMIGMFRRHGMGNYHDLLIELARSPAMIFWLDNHENHADAVNENWGRELLELFSMGVGNYTEVDVKECSRAFTGWTIAAKIPRTPYGRFDWSFEYKEWDHDDGEKTFLGHTGGFNGQDIIDIICQQPATARFLSRYLYSFFVADEPPVPSWPVTPHRDPEAIDTLAEVFMESHCDIRSVLRVLLYSDFFKEARFTRVKGPAELVVGSLRLVGGAEFPAPGFGELSRQPAYMGQDLMDPPTVEGWHTGPEWINSGSLMSRVNFVADLVGDTSLPGVQSIIQRLRARGGLSPEGLVNGCLDLLGPVEVTHQTHQGLIAQAEDGGVLRWRTEEEADASDKRVAEMLQLIVATREYQFA